VSRLNEHADIRTFARRGGQGTPRAARGRATHGVATTAGRLACRASGECLGAAAYSAVVRRRTSAIRCDSHVEDGKHDGQDHMLSGLHLRVSARPACGGSLPPLLRAAWGWAGGWWQLGARGGLPLNVEHPADCWAPTAVLVTRVFSCIESAWLLSGS
jgi:hypothetical protein